MSNNDLTASSTLPDNLIEIHDELHCDLGSPHDT